MPSGNSIEHGVIEESDSADVNGVVDNYGRTQLIIASNDGNTTIVQALLKVKDINVNIRSRDGNTALILAARKGHTKIVQALLAVPDIDVNVINSKKHSALMEAVFHGKIDVVKLLLDVPGIDLDATSSEGRDLLNIARMSKRNDDTKEDIIKLISNHLALKTGGIRRKKSRKDKKNKSKKYRRTLTKRMKRKPC